ncbi:MAG TPA: DUF6370 family protein [Gemmataceae bacterium]|nr:DUF6370 family protein [Gemmataceae bacterium]
MKTLGVLLVVVAMIFLFTDVDAGEKGKEVKLTGKITCAKCDFDTVKAADADLTKPKGCLTVIITKEKNKDVVYYFDMASHKKFHSPICKEAKEGTVTGTCVLKDGRRVVTATDVKFK